MKNHHMILVVNPGSTSLKYKLIEFPAETIVSSGKIERIGSTQSTYDVKIGKVQSTGSLQNLDYPLGVEWLLNLLTGKAIPQERIEICHGLEYLGILLDKDRNENAQNIEAKISKDGTNVEVWAIPTNEELIVGREVYKLIQ
jgi:acetate kinase